MKTLPISCWPNPDDTVISISRMSVGQQSTWNMKSGFCSVTLCQQTCRVMPFICHILLFYLFIKRSPFSSVHSDPDCLLGSLQCVVQLEGVKSGVVGQLLYHCGLHGWLTGSGDLTTPPPMSDQSETSTSLFHWYSRWLHWLRLLWTVKDSTLIRVKRKFSRVKLIDSADTNGQKMVK